MKVSYWIKLQRPNGYSDRAHFAYDHVRASANACRHT